MRLGYARKSTFDQQHALQIDALKADGCERIYVETASGLKTDRPELRQLLDHARPGDVIVVYSLSRLARSIRHLLELGEDLRARDIGLKSITEAIDTTSVSGRFMFNVLGAGLQAARARGRVGGRPKSLDPVKLTVAKTLIAEGSLTMSEIADHVGVAPSTIYRAMKGGRSALA
jgi:DNA invertase Pin-like site-specific DNA recombinase